MTLLMLISPLLILQSTSAPLPKPFTQNHMRDIGCIATLGLVADEQRRGIPSAARFPDLTERGKKYAGIAGDRIMFETGQTKEVVPFAMRKSVEDQQALAVEATANGKDPAPILDALMAQCLPLLDTQLGAENGN